MNYCAPVGIPVTVFTGERPAPGPGDEAWTDADRAAAYVWQSEQAERCSGCGHPLSDTMDEEQRHQWRADTVVCFACGARDRALAEVEHPIPGAYVVVERSGGVHG